MSMFINNELKELYFYIPNSEAPIEAQHKGIADRTVGSFYLSEKYAKCCDFFNHFEGEFFIDIKLCVSNARKMIDKLKDNKLERSFKKNLVVQKDSIVALEWYSKEESCSFYKISAPFVNEQKKYLKMDNLNEIYKSIKTFLIGDLTKLVFKKIGHNGFIIYVEESDDFNEKIDNGTVFSWGI